MRRYAFRIKHNDIVISGWAAMLLKFWKEGPGKLLSLFIFEFLNVLHSLLHFSMAAGQYLLSNFIHFSLSLLPTNIINMVSNSFKTIIMCVVANLTFQIEPSMTWFSLFSRQMGFEQKQGLEYLGITVEFYVTVMCSEFSSTG